MMSALDRKISLSWGEFVGSIEYSRKLGANRLWYSAKRRMRVSSVRNCYFAIENNQAEKLVPTSNSPSLV